MNELVSEIFSGIDKNLISEEVKTKVLDMLNKVVEQRVQAKTLEVSEKISKLEEDNKKLVSDMDTLKKDIEEKEGILKEAAAELGNQLAAEFKQKEEILAETNKEYQEQILNALKETAQEYKDVLVQEALGAAEEYKSFVETAVLEEAAEFKRTRQTADAQELEKFKADIINKADEYITAELKKNIPQNIFEAAAKATALEPLVEGVISVIEKHGIQVDKTGYEALKVAKAENAKLTESLNTKASDNIKLEKRVKDLEKSVKLNSLTEGMTQVQKTKAFKLLESASLEELDTRFKAIKDIIISESVKQVVKVSESEVSKGEVAKKQVQRIVESINNPTGKVSEIEGFKQSLDKMRRA